MNKGIGALIFGLIALVGGLVFVAILVKNKLSKEKEFEDENGDFDLTVDDEEFEHFFGDNNEDDLFAETNTDDNNEDIQVEVIAEEKPVATDDFESSTDSFDDTENNLFDNLGDDEQLPAADTSIADIDDDDLMGVTDVEEEQL